MIVDRVNPISFHYNTGECIPIFLAIICMDRARCTTWNAGRRWQRSSLRHVERDVDSFPFSVLILTEVAKLCSSHTISQCGLTWLTAQTYTPDMPAYLYMCWYNDSTANVETCLLMDAVWKLAQLPRKTLCCHSSDIAWRNSASGESKIRRRLGSWKGPRREEEKLTDVISQPPFRRWTCPLCQKTLDQWH